MASVYINGFDDFIAEANTLLTEGDECENAKHILVTISGATDFGFIRASRPMDTWKEARGRFSELLRDIDSMSCSYIPFQCGLSYVGEGESVIRKSDDCVFVTGLSLKELLALGNTYDQEVIVYGNKREIKSYTVSSGKPEVTLSAVDMKLAMATVLFYPGTYR